jgi:dTMP kinase
MKLNPGPGKLIVLEGLDGAGTTSQAKALERWLRDEKGVAVHITREPSDGPVGVQIRAVLGHRLTLDPRTLAALFAADRLDHLYYAGGVQDRLLGGEWVLMDRYYLSSYAYQSLQLDASGLRWLRDMHKPCLLPDVTFFLDVPVEVCLERIVTNRGARFELFEKRDVLEQVNARYRAAVTELQDEGERIEVIDGMLPLTLVTETLKGRMASLFAGTAATHPG